VVDCKENTVQMLHWDFEVHKEPLFKRYYGGVVSQASLVTFVCGFVLIVLPIFVGYNSWGIPFSNAGFWYKEGVYYEQPILDYRHQGVVQVYGRSSTGAPFNLYYSTSSVLNQQQGSMLRPGIIQSASYDDNHDGIMDRLELQVKMPLQPNEEVTGFDALFFHDIKLKNKAKILFDSVSHINYEGGDIPIQSVNIGGDIQVQQNDPFPASSSYKSPYVDSPLLPIAKLSAGLSSEQYGVREVLSNAANRHSTTHFSQTYSNSIRSSDVEESTHLDHTANVFDATINIRIPHQQIRIQPAIAEVLKVAWTQFMPIFLGFGFLVHRLLSFIFGKKLVSSSARADIVVQKED
jgi:hypothetical protein